MGADRATITVFEGRVSASNAAGTLTLASGESAVALAGQAPARWVLTVTPADAVQWALYYPPVVEYRAADFPDLVGETWPAQVRQSLTAYSGEIWKRPSPPWPASPETVTDVRFFVYRAALLLSVGRVDEAVPDIDRAWRSTRGAATRWPSARSSR